MVEPVGQTTAARRLHLYIANRDSVNDHGGPIRRYGLVVCPNPGYESEYLPLELC
ncbi:uncharacterized protein METZ01_LOCUS277108 [marine metagenome]|uniref:Uncharacterized protein n=1 Tax=marine metagenome TaxID=408172 RepID=A0A382KGZ4_9ZZZZ